MFREQEKEVEKRHLLGVDVPRVNAADLAQGSSSVCGMPGAIIKNRYVLKPLSSLLAVYPSATLSFLRLQILLFPWIASPFHQRLFLFCVFVQKAL